MKKEGSHANVYQTQDAERALWVNVVLQAIRDATDTSGERHPAVIRSRARLWFNLRNPDFVEVCNCAQLDPEATLEKARAAFARYDASGSAMPRNSASPLVRTGKQNRKPKLYTVNGESKSVAEWADKIGLSHGALRTRIRLTGSIAAAVSIPGRQYGRGRVTNLSEPMGTGAGRPAQESSEIDFPEVSQ